MTDPTTDPAAVTSGVLVVHYHRGDGRLTIEHADPVVRFSAQLLDEMRTNRPAGVSFEGGTDVGPDVLTLTGVDAAGTATVVRYRLGPLVDQRGRERGRITGDLDFDDLDFEDPTRYYRVGRRLDQPHPDPDPPDRAAGVAQLIERHTGVTLDAWQRDVLHALFTGAPDSDPCTDERCPSCGRPRLCTHYVTA